MEKTLSDISKYHVSEHRLWEGRYKIPWDEPGFSSRMLNEHLSQEHDLASRKAETIAAQVNWIHKKISHGQTGSLLDLGCGPGLYLERFMELGYRCTGIDFSPASINYAKKRLSDNIILIRGDLRDIDFAGGYNLAIMLFGELNVFSPDECARILSKTFDALIPGGMIVVEVHTFDVVKRFGLSSNTWYKSGDGVQGLFSDKPHLCLIENHWFESCRTAQQVFHIADAETGQVDSYRNTVKAWTCDEYRQLLENAKFQKVTEYPEWPVHSDDFILFSAIKNCE
ncbi:MAG: class I SAM-dependent methyltransferase [Candidatus Latescibacterota bacterium]